MGTLEMLLKPYRATHEQRKLACRECSSSSEYKFTGLFFIVRSLYNQYFRTNLGDAPDHNISPVNKLPSSLFEAYLKVETHPVHYRNKKIQRGVS